jgi:histidyl-tRNA synthetase
MNKGTKKGARIESVRGTVDILPSDYKIRKQVQDKLSAHFESFGYQPIEVPVIEYADLYLRKSGEETISRLYDFTYQNRHLCLRPEITASVLRAYIDNHQGMPLPSRFYSAGPVFRYEKPQMGRYRQFTQIGAELIGGKGYTVDAEVISVACQGLQKLGLNDYQVTIGHIGILASFLEALPLDKRLHNFLLVNMELLQKYGKERFIQRLQEAYPEFQGKTFAESPAEYVPQENLLTESLGAFDGHEARDIVLQLLKSMNIGLDGTRDPDEIVARLLLKMGRPQQVPIVNQALTFMTQLGQLQGQSFDVLKEAETLLATYDMSKATIEYLYTTIKAIQHYGVNPNQIIVDFGLNRGIRYYTGMIFEIHTSDPSVEGQICGGGRYDDLVSTLGGAKETSAAGFSYGIERIYLAIQHRTHKLRKKKTMADVLVIPVSSSEYKYAIQVATQLRNQGLSVEIDVRDRSVTSNFQYADKRGIPFAAVVGSEEVTSSVVKLKNLRSREEYELRVSNVALKINELEGFYAR